MTRPMSGCWRISSPNAATAPSTVRVAKEMATWQLSRMRVGMASPVARWVNSMTWMATLRPFPDQLLDQPGQLGDQGVVGLDLGAGAFALVEEGVGLVDHDHDQRPGRGGAKVPGVGDPEDLRDSALAVDHQPMDSPQSLPYLVQVVLRGQPGTGEEPVV